MEFLAQIDIATYWSIFLFGLLISTTAMSTGVDGAIFWAPLLLLVYKVDPAVAISCAIFIELFGFGSGVYGYAKRKKIKFKEAGFLLLFTIPLGVLGAYVSKILPSNILILMISAACIILAVMNFKRRKLKIQEKKPEELTIEKKWLGGIMSTIGGFFAGAIGVGIGETNNFYLLIKNKFPVTYAAGTTIFMVAATDLFISIFNILYFRKATAGFDLMQVASILIFAIPAVVIGARMGVILAHKLKRAHFNYYLASVFSVMAIISMYRAYANIGHEQIMSALASIF